MKTGMAISMILVLAVPAVARQKPFSPAETVTVCMGTTLSDVLPAQTVASEMFAEIGIRIDWRGVANCPQNAIQVSFRTAPDRDQRPRQLAYALPYEGIHLYIFCDRIRALAEDRASLLLAHVLVHEITHILQGIARHSEQGIMKAQWTAQDRDRMYHRIPLRFTAEDVELIRKGLARRTGISAESASARADW